jgi:hypothetical protein
MMTTWALALALSGVCVAIFVVWAKVRGQFPEEKMR